MSCAFSSQTITSKPKRRSRCGEFRGCPVLSSHLAPGFAPQVGQCLANIRLASRFFIPRLCPREQAERWSVLLTLGSLGIGIVYLMDPEKPEKGPVPLTGATLAAA